LLKASRTYFLSKEKGFFGSIAVRIRVKIYLLRVKERCWSLTVCVIAGPGIQTRERALAGSCEEDYLDKDLGDAQVDWDLGDGQLEGDSREDQVDWGPRGCQVDWGPRDGQAGAISANQPLAGSPAAEVVSSRVLDALRMKQQDAEFITSSCCKNPGRSRQRKGPARQRKQKQASGMDRQEAVECLLIRKCC
jgi:hypothetical protein